MHLRRGLVYELGKACIHVGYRLVSLGTQLRGSTDVIDLGGDRDVEWSWVLAELPIESKDILDFGPGPFPLLSMVAARRGCQVTAIDRREMVMTALVDGIELMIGDINTYDFGQRKSDVIVNCSTIEHVGLGGRYEETESESADLEAMTVLRALLKPGGKMILTLPVGQDAVHRPYHRVYGPERLPRLLHRWHVDKSEFWAKPHSNLWERVPKEQALQVVSSKQYYALGLFVLS